MKRKVLIFVSIVPIFLLISGVFIFENKKSIYNGVSFKEKIIFPNLETKKNNEEENIKMLFFGDLMLDRDVKIKIEQKGVEYILDKLDKNNFFDGYDVVSANFEGTVTDDGKYYWPEKKFDFVFLPKDVLFF